MMGIESSIQSICGAFVSGKCYPITNTVGSTAPYITFQKITGGDFMLSVESDKTSYQIDVFGKTYNEARTLADSVKAAFKASTTLPNVREMEFDDYDEIGRLYRRVLQFGFWIA